MATNPIPDPLDALFTLAEDAADGLSAHETQVAVKQNTAAVMREALTAAQAAQTAYQAARAAKQALTAVQQVADSNAKAFLATARNVLANYLGGTWSQAWEPTGFPNQSTAVPSTVAERQALPCSSPSRPTSPATPATRTSRST
ncbi:MAG: hypothetical protein COY42_02800 [Armatimonadetes bacterium CG_4_10_14_0_8_um_filter_66_14]|nr:MAG: hypothetical protein COY42_02800 [Armatimonadetes bacterium CG_4_10_14_0_8_um_filter_66_14]